MDEVSTSRTPPSEKPRLTPVEARILGCLIEKELTTPEYYPLSLNALLNACNQRNNRDPVMALTLNEVEPAVESLRLRHFISLVAGDTGRVPKFRQTLDHVHPMERADRVILCELLIRGPQTTGELRGRCERMHPFADLAAVEAAIARLAGRPSGALVVRLARQPGQKEARWAELLTGHPALSADDNMREPAPLASAQPAAFQPGPTLPPEAESRLTALESEVAQLREQVAELRRKLGLA